MRRPRGSPAVGSAEAVALRVSGLAAGYLGEPVVSDVGLEVHAHQLVAILGPNGAGKSTTLKAVGGVVRPYGGRVSLFGEDVGGLSTSAIVRRGAVYLPQERAVFGEMTVDENLTLGASLVHERDVIRERREMVCEMFPILADRVGQQAGTMSGGEQRMLALGIALMAGARVLLLDEPSLGLAPRIYEVVLDAVVRLVRDDGLAVVVVEQQLELLDVVDHVYVLRAGRIVLEEDGGAARQRDDWWEYF